MSTKRKLIGCEKEIVKSYLEGKSLSKLGTQFGVVHSTIKAVLIERGIPIRNIIAGFCKKGHSVTGDNAYVSRDGKASCKICQKENSRRYWIRIQGNPELYKKRLNASKRYRRNNPDTGLLWKYGITAKHREDMLKKQNGGCAICSRILDIPYIDHDHETDQLRGMLCRNCNSGIGLLQDNISVLESALAYLKKWKSNALSV